MQKVVLLGENIRHSRSPLILNTLFRKYGIPLHYELEPLTASEIGTVVERMKREGYRGANITSPHKESIVQTLDRLDPTASSIGAVNTISIDTGEATGHNTDVDGFLVSLENEPLLQTEFSAAVLGAGGAGRAAVTALLGLPNVRGITIYSRRPETASAAAGRFDDRRVTAATLEYFVPADLIVHATPLGLPRNPGALLSEEQLKGGTLLYEMIYSPAETELMRSARRAGLRTRNGEQMLVGQALRAFEIWTGIQASVDDLPVDLFKLPLPESRHDTA